ncbi:SCO family protein [Olivibacter sp. SDN3]|uniref:SCO family protein n=1 Tax=Olivibacter sp. SDN3 TaxID=2764720 RepID=UPI001651802B|nr:SCO family protein [Olivibacter sp. SDN3]QNL48656.1 SCO family protein [Olivibacter sp. SDN3]
MDEFAFKTRIDELRAQSDAKGLISFLKEQHPAYKEKSANAVTRMRAYVIYSFYLVGLPEEALLFIYEELESSKEPYLIAAAAIALRRSPQKYTEMAALLVTAIHNVKSSDTYISFHNYYQPWPLNNPTTAIGEVLTTLQWLGAYARSVLPKLHTLSLNSNHFLNAENLRALRETIQIIEQDQTIVKDCCSDIADLNSLSTVNAKKNRKNSLKQVLLEDHDGTRIPLGALLKGKLTLIAFFYTRCDNPLKCSLTITKLADLQKKLATAYWNKEVNLVAISYDSFYDLPYRMKKYGEARGMMLNEQARMCRALPDIGALSDYFDLSVNYTGEVVNRHAIELYLLDDKAQIIKRFNRRQIDNSRIMANLEKIVVKQQTKVGQWFSNLRYMTNSAASVVWPVMILLLPKCPFCFAAYFSVLGIASMQVMPYLKYIFPILLCAMAINIYALYKMGLRRNSFIPLYLCVLGSTLVIVFGYFSPMQFGLIAGLILLFLSATLNSLPNRVYLKLKTKFHLLS